MHKDMQANKKKAKYSIPWLLLSVIAELKIKDGLGLDARTNSDFSRSELQPLTLRPPPREKNMQGQQKVLLRPLVTKKIINILGWEGQNQEN